MDQPIFSNLEVDEISGNYFKTASRWALFISIVYIACILLVGIVLLTSMDDITPAYKKVMADQQVDIEIGAVVAILIVVFVIILIITYFFLAASLQIKKGVNQRNQEIFNSGLGHLKNGLMIYGIVGLIGIIFRTVALFL